MSLALRVAALLVGLALAAWGCDSKGSMSGKLTAVRAQGDPVVLAIKDGAPYISANVADDLPALREGDPSSREDALIRKAIHIVLDRAVKHGPYDGKDLFHVRLVVLHELDEYGKAKAGSSIELATLEVPRPSLEGLTADHLRSISGPELRKLVRNASLKLDNLDKFE
jgi:hypothetical protein